ncbi:MAG: hypothetical protein R2706_07765 [Acidimicrobiales bacterium]
MNQRTPTLAQLRSMAVALSDAESRIADLDLGFRSDALIGPLVDARNDFSQKYAD